MKEAMHYTKSKDFIICNLCPHKCKLMEGQVGICSVRKFIDDKLYSINYARISSINLDPIEKKPLYHFKPGTFILSVGSFGCNFNCSFCQNYSISKNIPYTKTLVPEKLIDLAKKYKLHNNIGIAFTYNEPTIFYEYIFDTINLLDDDLDVVLVTNGYIESNPLKDIIHKVSAMNIDLKAFSNTFYKNICKGSIEEVLKTIELAHKYTHVEITTLIIPNTNDSISEIEQLAIWISNIDKDIPLHLSRYYPAYKFDKPATPIDTLLNAYEVAKQHLNYVYIGNVLGIDNNTYCSKCGFLLIERNGYVVNKFLQDATCPNCNAKVNIVI